MADKVEEKVVKTKKSVAKQSTKASAADTLKKEAPSPAPKADQPDQPSVPSSSKKVKAKQQEWRVSNRRRN